MTRLFGGQNRKKYKQEQEGLIQLFLTQVSTYCIEHVVMRCNAIRHRKRLL